MTRTRKFFWGGLLLTINCCVIVVLYTFPFEYKREVDLPIPIEKGHHAIIFFGFVRCPSVCPTTLQALSKVYQQKSLDIPLIFVNTENTQPNGATALEYAKSFHPTFDAWQLPENQRIKLLKEFNAFYIEAQPSIGKAASHSTAIYFLSKEQNKWYIRSMYTQYPPNSNDLGERIDDFLHLE